MGVIAYCICVVAASGGISFVAHSVASGIVRQPEVQGRLFTIFTLGAAFIEALALIGFVVTLIAR